MNTQEVTYRAFIAHALAMQKNNRAYLIIYMYMSANYYRSISLSNCINYAANMPSLVKCNIPFVIHRILNSFNIQYLQGNSD